MVKRLTLVVTACCIVLGFQAEACKTADDEMRPIGQHKDGTSDLVIIFKKKLHEMV